ncbi:chorismate synthase [candidate division FCPU426 bacterium]|nr:chorismate synthase [candidate division FCPU426 bacterium]
MLRFLTAGESHGQGLTLIIEGLPAGMPLTSRPINLELARRQQGYGRGQRMLLEKDQAQITAGTRHGQTLGTPLALFIPNRDWTNWQDIMHPEKRPSRQGEKALFRPRPGHADLAGALKYGRKDLRDILERASARETAARVAAGAVAKILLRCFGLEVGSWVVQIGDVRLSRSGEPPQRLFRRALQSDLHCPEAATAARMRRAIDRRAREGDTLGGVFAVAAWGMIPGLGSHVHWDRRLDMRLAGALMSIPAIKGVEFGLGFQSAALPGSAVHDVIIFKKSGANGGFGRRTNHAGGIEGGISTGKPILAQAAMKPIATLRKPLASIDMRSKRRQTAASERSDVCAVPAAAVVGEAMVAIELARACQEKFGGDALAEMMDNWRMYARGLARR